MEKFSYEEQGYNRREVNEFLSDVIRQTEGIINKCESQTLELNRLKSELDRYRNLENDLKTAVTNAKEAEQKTQEVAEKQANLIITDAKNNASRIVNEALLQADKINVNVEKTRNELQTLKRKLKLIMDQQNAIIEEIEVLDIN